MPSELIDQLENMFPTTSNNSKNALRNNYIYINEDKISCSLICPICLNPLIDPQTHVLCENSFCNCCISKLKHCPCCQTSITEPNDLKMTSHILRNILDELQVQCNICKQILCRGDFDLHIRTNCLEHSSERSNEENILNSNEIIKKKYLLNLYHRIHKLEHELYELKKVIFLFLFVLLIIGIIYFSHNIFLYIFNSFLPIIFTIYLPILIKIISKILLDFSPLIIFLRLAFVNLYFYMFYYKTSQFHINIVTIIIYLIIIMQALRQSLTIAIQRRITFIRPSLTVQQVRYDGSDSRSSDNQKKSGKQSDPSKGSNLNKTKTSDKKQKLKSTDDTKQPGTTREDWSKPDQVVSNDPPYGKAGGSTDARDPDRGKKA